MLYYTHWSSYRTLLSQENFKRNKLLREIIIITLIIALCNKLNNYLFTLQRDIAIDGYDIDFLDIKVNWAPLLLCIPNQSRQAQYLTKQPVNVACSWQNIHTGREHSRIITGREHSRIINVVQKPSNNFLLGPIRNRCPKSNLCRVSSQLPKNVGFLAFCCSIQNLSLHIIWHFFSKFHSKFKSNWFQNAAAAAIFLKWLSKSLKNLGNAGHWAPWTR